MIKLLVQEANIQYVDASVTFLGDIHGQLHDLLTLFEVGELPDTQDLFLGYSVD